MSAAKLTIGGRKFEGAPGTTVLKAALALEIDIPIFSYDVEFSPDGVCRIC